MEYHVAVQGKQEGPLTEDEVRQRIASHALQPTDHCWAAGWEEWRLLQDIFPEECRAATPAPLPSWETIVEPLDEAEERRRRLPVRQDRTSAGIFAVLGVLALLLIVAGIGWTLWRGSGAGDTAAAPAEPSTPLGSRGREAAERNARRDALRNALRETEFSGSNLEQIAEACVIYAKANGGELPAYSSQLEPLFGARFAAVMDVPETPERESSGYVVRMGLNLAMSDDTPIAFEARSRPDGSRGVVYLDGTVRVLKRGDPELARALQR